MFTDISRCEISFGHFDNFRLPSFIYTDRVGTMLPADINSCGNFHDPCKQVIDVLTLRINACIRSDDLKPSQIPTII